jgi:hypothetical protein
MTASHQRTERTVGVAHLSDTCFRAGCHLYLLFVLHFKAFTGFYKHVVSIDTGISPNTPCMNMNVMIDDDNAL